MCYVIFTSFNDNDSQPKWGTIILNMSESSSDKSLAWSLKSQVHKFFWNYYYICEHVVA